MNRFASVLALALVVALPAAVAAKTAPPAPGAMSTAPQPVCSAADPVVWVNTTSKVYHTKTSSWFGRTKSGQFACQSKAVAMGAHPAGASTMSKGAPAAVEPSPMASSGKKKHGKKSSEMPGMAMPAASPTPK